jgi:hypothetical protein
VFCKRHNLSDKHFLHFGSSDDHIKSSNSFCHLMKVHASTHYQEQDPKGRMSTFRNFDEHLNIIDDFKTNLLWLSMFIRSVEGVSMRTPVNCRRVLQSNYFKHQEEGKETKTMLDAVCKPDGDTFQNSPLKLVFYLAFDKGPAKTTGDDKLKLSSISKIN